MLKQPSRILSFLQGTFSIIQIELIVLEHAEWGLNLAESNLEIMPGGDYIQVQLEQRGNTPSTPYMTNFGTGWNISHPW